MKKSRSRKRQITRKRRSNLALIAVVLLLLCGVIGYKKVDLQSKEAAYVKKIDDLEKDMKAEEERTEEIEDYEAYVQSKQYIEQEARDKLGLVYPDEIVFEAEEE